MPSEKEKLHIFIPAVRTWGMPRVFSLAFTDRRMIIIKTGWVFFQKAFNSRAFNFRGPKRLWITGEAKKNENPQVTHMRKELQGTKWEDIVQKGNHDHLVPLERIFFLRGSKRLMENLCNFNVKFKDENGKKYSYTFIIPVEAFEESRQFLKELLPAVFQKK